MRMSLKRGDGAGPGRFYTLLVPLFGLLLFLGAGGVLFYLSGAVQQHNLATAQEDASNFAHSVTQFRNFYSAEIVPRARAAGMNITHDYRHLPDALPLPATFTLNFGEFLSSEQHGFKVSLYSDKPFPWRARERKLDDFQVKALRALSINPSAPVVQLENRGGEKWLRYAVADRLLDSCVACHNSYPGSPRTDWKAGDVRGVLEIQRPMTAGEVVLQSGIRNAVLVSVSLIIASMLLVSLTLRGLRRSVEESRALAEATRKANARLQAEIAQREEVEQTLRFNEGKLLNIFDSILEGVVVIDQQGRIIQINRVTCAMFGYPQEELLGRNVALLMPEKHAHQHDEYLARYLRTGEGMIIGRVRQEMGRRKDGSCFPIHLAVSEVRAGDAVFFTAVISDITERLAYERELQQARDTALDSARMKSEFLANMSHEIRTPMNGVIGMTGLLLDTPLSPEQRELVETVQRSADALLTVINDILDFSKIEAGKLEMVQAGFSPVQVLEETLDLLGERAASKGLELGYVLQGPVPARMLGDGGRFRQVLNNLIGNAIKFTETGWVQVEMGPAPGGGLEVRVRDTGMGIPADKLRYLFQPFSQVDGSVTRQFGGTGLGLAISRQLVELMGGRIGVESELGRGSAFTFQVAFQPLPGNTDTVASACTGTTVLLWGEGAVLPAQLRGWGLEVTACQHLDQVLAALAAAPQAGLLLDVPEDGATVHQLGQLQEACARRGLPPPRLCLLLHRGQGLAGASALASLPRLYKPLRLQAMLDFLHQRPALPARPDASPALAESSGYGGRRVLVVEDNPVNQKLIQALLLKTGVELTLAGNGEEALALMQARPFDLVLMDCQMPVLDGLEATRRWRLVEATDGRRRLPVVALTANAMEGDRERCLAAGMDDYLSKPIKREALEEKLASWLA